MLFVTPYFLNEKLNKHDKNNAGQRECNLNKKNNVSNLPHTAGSILYLYKPNITVKI